MEKLKVFLFHHGEKVGLAAVAVLCLVGLLVAHPWSTGAMQDSVLKQDLTRLEAKVKAGPPEATEFAHLDFVAQLDNQLRPSEEVHAFPATTWPTVDIVSLPESRQNYPGVASVAEVKVVPERGGLRVTWSIDPQKQAIENAQARYEGVVQLVRAVVYRAPAESPTQLQELGTVPLDDVVVVPAVGGPGGGARPGRFLGGPPAGARAAVPAGVVAEGKVSADEADRAGRFAYADRSVKPEQDYVYKVKLVGKNPRYDPTNPAGMPEFIESDLASTELSLAQRPLPSIRWFFMGGNTEQASVRVYRWHVFSVAASEQAGGGGSPATGGAAPAGARPGAAASGPAGVAATGTEAAAPPTEIGQWVVANFAVRPGDPIGREVQGYFAPSGVSKPEQLTIDFSTGCTVVAVEGALRITDTPVVTLTAAGAPGSSGRLVRDSLLLYYIDPAGVLRTRWQEPDLVLAEQLTAPGVAGGPGATPTAVGAPGGTRMTAEAYQKQMEEGARRRREEAARREEAVKRAQEADKAHAAERSRHQAPGGGGPPGGF
jgi:hypothetical protein